MSAGVSPGGGPPSSSMSALMPVAMPTIEAITPTVAAMRVPSENLGDLGSLTTPRV